MGLSTDNVAEGAVIHFTGDGTAGAGGRLAGASRVLDRLKTAGGKCGGMMKTIASSLWLYREQHRQ